MKTKILLLSLCLLFGFYHNSYTQKNAVISDDPGYNAHSSAMLDIYSSSKGLLIPRLELTDLEDDTSPVNSPETGLLIFNEAGSFESGFYYWDSNRWVLVGSDATPLDCVTLDQAYGCNQPGQGRFISASNGAVEITLTEDGTSDIGLQAISEKGTSDTPTSAIHAGNHEFGQGITAINTNVDNLFAAVEGLTYGAAESGEPMPSGVAGFFHGEGRGAGVIGKSYGAGGMTGVAAGVYGEGLGENFGGYFFSEGYGGVHAETEAPSVQALQVVSADENPINIGMLVVGRTQFSSGISPDGTLYGANALINNSGGEITIGPDAGGYGTIGTGLGLHWWSMYALNIVPLSQKELKRDIKYLDDNIYHFVMTDIEKLKPALYKYKNENDKIIEGAEHRTRYSKRIGLMVEDKETPDYIKDNTFSGIDLYSLTTLAISGVQHNRKSIKEIEKVINDFGVAQLNGNEVKVTFNNDFNGNIPVVTITPFSPGNDYYIKELNQNSFTIAVDEPANFQFNWIAMANNNSDNQIVNAEKDEKIDEKLKSQLHIDDEKRNYLRKLLLQKHGEKEQQIMDVKRSVRD